MSLSLEGPSDGTIASMYLVGVFLTAVKSDAAAGEGPVARVGRGRQPDGEAAAAGHAQLHPQDRYQQHQEEGGTNLSDDHSFL